MSEFNSFQPPGPLRTLKPGWLIAIGCLLIVLGVLAWIDAVFTTLASVVLIGVLMVFGGVAQLAQAFAQNQVSSSNKWFMALAGVLYVLGGLLVIEEPVTGSVFVTAFLAGCLIFSGIARAAWASGHRYLSNWWGMLLSAIITLLVGALIFMTLPWSGLWLLGTLIGIELIFAGAAMVGIGTAASRAL
ncbi:HdeD family acid-resistance protein [Brytella acorum]|uniref:HdeD family acid-resistance protein n=1 Tax=Brytella acorum TaxID=2959299 RepID=A0AA35URY7_9PROT|nr:HdeD family acid-resistance protein [Brytella acorum]MDF3625049.1 HdeD family acid-resistance protein [Brytella acorum]CAI9121072.1 HdeD family acid-resistance protein [Brytella acorum]